ncbi:hypothetical protein [Methylorubrum extorquens]
MGDLNMPQVQKTQLAKIDTRALDDLIDQAISDRSASVLYPLGLTYCGDYVARHFRAFEESLRRHGLAKSSKKFEDTCESARREGWDLKYAVSMAQTWMKEAEKEAELFYIDDDVWLPLHLSTNLSVTVSYRWRRDRADEWSRGHITFKHVYEPRTVYGTPASKRKPIRAQQEKMLHDKLCDEWERLKKGALFSVRDYFREGRDGREIPETYRVSVDGYYRTLNNFSTKFWRDAA